MTPTVAALLLVAALLGAIGAGIGILAVMADRPDIASSAGGALLAAFVVAACAAVAVLA